MTAVEKLLAVALGEEGYLEKKSLAQLDDKTANAGSGNYTKYARDLDRTDIFNTKKQGFDWCAVFYIWPFVMLFGEVKTRQMLYLPKKSCAAGVDWLVRYFEAAGAFTRTPVIGGPIFFKNAKGEWQHVEMVTEVKDGTVYTIGGNTSGASGVVWNGGGVARKSYPINYARLGGYGRPDWAVVADYDEEEEEMTDEQKEALFQEFLDRLSGEELAAKLYGYLTPQELPNWAEGELREAMDLGITDGTRPMGFVHRFEAALMAKRAAKVK